MTDPETSAPPTMIKMWSTERSPKTLTTRMDNGRWIVVKKGKKSFLKWKWDYEKSGGKP